MSARAARSLASPASKPALPRHVRLQYDPLRQAWALLSPEKVLWPDEASLSILKMCDGKTEIAAISETLAREFDADAATIQDDVIAFAQDWSDRMVLRL